MKFGYARVSTGDQQLSLRDQEQTLGDLGCREVFPDIISGARSKRPGLDRLKERLRPGDVVVVTRLDRLGRSPIDTIRTIEQLTSEGVVIKAEDVGLDTSNPLGQAMLVIMAALANWEREMIRERTKAGVARARADGRLPGRKPRLSLDQQRMVRRLRADGDSVSKLAAAFSVSEMTIRRALAVTKTSDGDDD